MTAPGCAEWFPRPTRSPRYRRGRDRLRQKHFFDVLLVDTPGRLAIDELLMAENQGFARHAQARRNPVRGRCHAGPGCDQHRQGLQEALPLTGIVLTKLDGDSARRCGAVGAPDHGRAHQVRRCLRKDRRPGRCFDADRHAQRVLGMATSWPGRSRSPKAWTWKPRRRWPKRSKSGDGFDLNDFLAQLQQMKQMGGLSRPDGQSCRRAGQSRSVQSTWTRPSARSKAKKASSAP